MADRGAVAGGMWGADTQVINAAHYGELLNVLCLGQWVNDAGRIVTECLFGCRAVN
ncbi:hypothetical protein BCR34DRAFT_557366, partial [Clohesyomyces aquaticus]